MKHILIIFIVFISLSCESQITSIVGSINNSNTSQNSNPEQLDYTSNLYDEWVANRGFIVNSDNTTIQSWTGYRNGILITPTSNFTIPSNSDLTLSVNTWGFTLPASTTVTGDVTLAYVIKSSSRRNAEQRLFHAVGTPQLIIDLETSSANVNMGMIYNSQSLNFGTSFPFDGQYHVLVFKILSGVGASVYLDGVKVGNTVTFSSSTSIDWTANSTRRLFRTASTGQVSFVGSARKVRIYKEALSDDKISIISDHSNAFFNKVTDSRTIYRLYNMGQSNANGSQIVTSDLPINLRGDIPNCFVWDFNLRKFVPLNSDSRPVNFGIGPIFQTAWLHHQQYPDALIYINSYCIGGTSLAVDWAVGTGQRYLEWFQYYNACNTLLEIEERMANVIDTYITWVQGENDAQVQSQANAYQTNEFNFITDVTSRLGITDIRVMNICNRLNLGTFPYRETVRSAKSANALAFSNMFFINPDDAVRYPLGADGIHYTWTGYENYATDLFNK